MFFLLLGSLIVVLIGYAYHHKNYWKRRSIPGPQSRIFLGNLQELGDQMRKPLPLQLAEWTKKFGKYYGIQRGCVNALVISDPKMAHEVMVDKFDYFHERDLAALNGNTDTRPVAHVFNSRGMRWKRLRTLTSLVFTTKSLKKVFPLIDSCSDQMISNLDNDLKESQIIDFSGNLKEYTADIILRSAFGRNEDRTFIRQLICGILESFDQFRGLFFKISWVFPPIGPFLGYLNRLNVIIFNKGFGSFFKQMRSDIEGRKKMKQLDENKDEEARDFIDLLMEAESEEVVLQNMTDFEKKKAHHIQKRMTIFEVIGTCIVFLVAGFDTTANTLSFTVYYLAKSQEVQEKLRKEIEEFCGDGEISYDQLGKLTYSDAVMKETLRLNPIAASVTSRRCTKPTTIGNMEIEKGTDIILDVISIQRDKEIFGEDAEKFNPNRWLSGNPPISDFYGFGGGPRVCVGLRLAIIEQKMALIKLLRNYRIHEIAETKEAEQISGLILSPKNVKVRMEKI